VTAAHALLAEVHRRGAVAYRVGDRLRIRPAAAVPPELVERLRQHKAELMPLVPERDAAPAPAANYQRIYDTLTAMFGTTEDLAAFSALYDAGAHDLPERLAALEGDCEQLARDGAPEAEYRQAVEALVEFVHRIRAEYQRAQQAEPERDPAPPSTWRGVAIADPCLVCGGVEYRVPPVNGLVHCVHCSDPEPSAGPRRRGRR